MGPFCRHILDAIQINIVRMFSYASLSSGKSIPISLGLIGFELFIIPLAIFYDLSNLLWRKRGLGVLDEDFMDMKLTSEFKTVATYIPNGEFEIRPVAKWRNNIDKLLIKQEWPEAYKEIINLRMDIESKKKMYPLLNHFIESVHRSVALTIIWSKKCEGDDLLKVKFHRYRRWLIWWQMVGFEGSLALDYLAWPLRKKGLLILEQDVPIIPVPIP
jgi:hypothetical protein